MAIWQADFEIIPSADGLPPDYAVRLARILPPARSWNQDLEMFGREDGHRIDVWSENGRPVEITMRIDMRYPDQQLFEQLLNFVNESGCELHTENEDRVGTELLAFLEALRSSPAFRFVNDPNGFIRRIGTGEERMDWKIPRA